MAPIHCACTLSSSSILSYLVSSGFSLSQGITNTVPSSLFFALLADSTSCLLYLLQHGFSLDQHGTYLSLLHLLVLVHKAPSFETFLRFFLARGLSINAQTAAGDSYLHLAVQHHNTSAIVALLAHHIDTSLTNKQNLTAFQLAEQAAQPLIIEALMSVYRVPVVVPAPAVIAVEGEVFIVRWKCPRLLAIPAVDEYQVRVTDLLRNRSLVLPQRVSTHCTCQKSG